MDWINSQIIQHLGLTLVHFIWQGAVIGALYAVANALLRGASAQIRYDLAVITLVVLAAAPVVTFFYLGSAPADPVAAASGSIERLALTVGVSSSGTAGTSDVSVLFWVVGGWLLGVAFLSLRLLLGWRHLSKLRRSADQAYTAHLAPMLSRISRELGITRRVCLAASARINSPVVVGWIRPLILLPPAVVTGLPTRQLEMVLAHELAHIRRFDHFVNLFQTVVETLLFYHPVVIWVSRRIRVERENACDDLAVAVTDNRLAYVEMLATLERLRRPAPRLVLAINDGQMLSRIRRLVEQSRPSRQHGLTVPGLVLTTLLASAVGISFLPESADEAGGDTAHSAPEPVTIPVPEPRRAAEDTTPETVPVADVERAESQPSQADSPDHETISPEAASEPARPSMPEPAIDNADPVSDAGSSQAPRDLDSPANTPEPRAVAQNAPSGENADAPPTSADESVRPDPEINPATTSESSPAPEPAVDPEPSLDRPLAMVSIPETGQIETPEAPSRTVEPDPPQVTGGDILRRIEPNYPVRARQRRATGMVEVEFQVDTDGTVKQVRVLNERPRGMGFASAATDAVEQWRFEPFRKDGQPISRPARIEIDFDLEANQECHQRTGTRVPRC